MSFEEWIDVVAIALRAHEIPLPPIREPPEQ
jgi:hypothetical protein